MARICPNAACGKRYPDDAAFCGECGAITLQQQAPSDLDPRIGQSIGEFVVVARVADGAMGRVYEGRHHQTHERVAIKVLHAEVARDAVAVERFKREYETARELAHPNVVKVIDFGATGDGLSYMVMEYLEGEELGQVLRRGVPLEAARVVRLFAQLGVALDYAHSFGVIHRDLKPDNIFLCRSAHGDVLRILDFGSVKLQMETGPKLTAFGTTLGSPYYMSPEQAMGKQDVDQRSDVFAIAAILYECLTGKLAFDAPSVAQILMSIINQQPTPPSQLRPGLPPRIDDVIDQGLRKNKADRYPSVSALAADVCDAYGLDPDVPRWAATHLEHIERALKASSPPAARAYSVTSLPAGAKASYTPSESAPTLPVRSNNFMLGVVVGALAIVALIAVLLMR